MIFRMDECIALIELMFSNCFEEKPLLQCCTDLDFLVYDSVVDSLALGDLRNPHVK